MDISSLDDTAHRAVSLAKPVAASVADAVTDATSSALSTIDDMVGGRRTRVTSVVRVVRGHPVAVAAGAVAIAGGIFWWRSRSSAADDADVTDYRLSEVRDAA